METLRPTTFSTDDGPSYPGYTYGRTWNGWACPYFTHATALRLTETWNQAAREVSGPPWRAPRLHAAYDADTDTFVFADEDADSRETCAGEIHQVDGQAITLYPIGNGAWCWDEEPA